jgi:hypothetical protein
MHDDSLVKASLVQLLNEGKLLEAMTADESGSSAASPSNRSAVSSIAQQQVGLPGLWVEFKVVGQPGRQGGGDAAKSAPQPPNPPRAALTVTPLDAARNKVPVVLLNLPTLPPRGLKQALSSFR